MTTFLVRPSANRGKPAAKSSSLSRSVSGELLVDLVVAHDRAGDELREHRDVGRELHRALLRVPAVAVDVDDVADVVEGEERDADRQRQLHRRDGGAVEQLGHRLRLLRGEAGVLPHAEHREVGEHRRDQQGLAGAGTGVHRRAVERDARGEVDHHDAEQAEHERAAAEGVQPEAGHGDEDVAEAPGQQPVEEQQAREEVPEEQRRREGHGFLGSGSGPDQDR